MVFDKPRLIQADGIQCDAALAGHLTFMKNQDVPGVIGHVGTVLGRNRVNIANFSLGRREAPLHLGEPLEALALVTTDEPVSEQVLAQLRENSAVRFAHCVELGE
jgi:D-3-phosphoglycerate dehydrogenase